MAKPNEVRIYPEDKLYNLLKKGAKENRRGLAAHTVLALEEHFGMVKNKAPNYRKGEKA